MRTNVLLIAAVMTLIGTQALPVNMARDIYPLQEAVKSLEARVAALEERIDALEGLKVR